VPDVKDPSSSLRTSLNPSSDSLPVISSAMSANLLRDGPKFLLMLKSPPYDQVLSPQCSYIGGQGTQKKSLSAGPM